MRISAPLKVNNLTQVRLCKFRAKEPAMNLKNRTLWLFSVISITSSLFVTPASASEITVDTSRLKVPAGVTFSIDGVRFEGGYSQLFVTFSSTQDATSKVLAFKDFEITGIMNGANPVANKTQYFYGDSFNVQNSILLLEEDITAKKLNLVISGNATLENRSDIAYPKSYSRVIAALDTMGLEVTEGYNAWSNNNEYSHYVLAKLKAGVVPFQIKVKSATLSSNGVVVDTLKVFNQPTQMGVEPVEIYLGSGLVDPSIKLTEVALDAVFAVYTPSTLTSSISLPAGITSEALTKNSIYYDSLRNKSEINILLKNTTDKTISVNLAKLKVIDKSSGTDKVTATVDKNYGLASIQPGTGDNEGAYINFSGDGDLTENLVLDIEGAVEIATPSKFNVSKVKLPKGFKLLPIDFSNMGYDPKKNTTFVYFYMSKSSAGADSPALSFKNLKLTAGKPSTTYLYAGPSADKVKGLQSYSHEVGSFKGDIRTGKTLTISGDVVAIARTKYTNTATLAANAEGVVAEPNAIPAEYWKYNAKTKTTSITQYFYAEKESSVATIYSCNLKILLNGKSIKAPEVGVKLDSATYGQVVIATLPGDLRVKGGSVEVTGNYSLQPCK